MIPVVANSAGESLSVIKAKQKGIRSPGLALPSAHSFVLENGI